MLWRSYWWSELQGKQCRWTGADGSVCDFSKPHDRLEPKRASLRLATRWDGSAKPKVATDFRICDAAPHCQSDRDV